MSVADRIAIQADLIWTGDFNGIANGDFGERTIAAVKAFQKGNGGKETGVLTPQERTALTASAKEKQETAGWHVLDDAATGARLGLPLKMAPQARRPQGRHPLGLGARRGGDRDVPRARARHHVSPRSSSEAEEGAGGRMSEYNVLRPDFFVISGLQGLKKFYVRAHVKDDEVRGVTILYDQAMEGHHGGDHRRHVERPITAFPTGERRPAAQAQGGLRHRHRGRRQRLRGGRPAGDRGLLRRDARRALGRADLVAEDKGAGLALLRVYGARDLSPLAAGDAKGSDVTLVGIADPQAQGGGSDGA